MQGRNKQKRDRHFFVIHGGSQLTFYMMRFHLCKKIVNCLMCSYQSKAPVDVEVALLVEAVTKSAVIRIQYCDFEERKQLIRPKQTSKPAMSKLLFPMLSLLPRILATGVEDKVDFFL